MEENVRNAMKFRQQPYISISSKWSGHFVHKTNGGYVKFHQLNTNIIGCYSTPWSQRINTLQGLSFGEKIEFI